MVAEEEPAPVKKNTLDVPFRWMGHDQTTVQTVPQLPKPEAVNRYTLKHAAAEDMSENYEDQQFIPLRSTIAGSNVSQRNSNKV